VKFHDLLLITTKLDIKLKSSDDIEDIITNLTAAIQCTAWNSSTLTTNIQKPFQLNLPTYIRNLITEKRRARSLWKVTRYPSNKTRLNTLTAHLKKSLAKFRNDSYYKHISSLSIQDGSIWKTTKRVLRDKPCFLLLKILIARGPLMIQKKPHTNI